MSLEGVIDERNRRFSLWRELRNYGGPGEVKPAIVKQLGLHRGQQGIYRDLNRTQALGYTSGVAVGILHTGRIYSDDLWEESLVYHFPVTVRGGRDTAETLSIKLCRELQIPLFVVVRPHPSATTRNVHLGWVQDWNDQDSSILIQFSETEAEPGYIDTSAVDGTKFQLRQDRNFRHAKVKVRPNQLRFRFEVLKRYGTACAVCDVAKRELLDAAHLCPVEDGGSDDARNGLVFCLNHHRAYDKGLFRIDPSTLRIVGEADFQAYLGITRTAIDHLRKLPHPEALAWAFAEGAPNDASK